MVARSSPPAAAFGGGRVVTTKAGVLLVWPPLLSPDFANLLVLLLVGGFVAPVYPVAGGRADHIFALRSSVPPRKARAASGPQAIYDTVPSAYRRIVSVKPLGRPPLPTKRGEFAGAGGAVGRPRCPLLRDETRYCFWLVASPEHDGEMRLVCLMTEAKLAVEERFSLR